MNSGGVVAGYYVDGNQVEHGYVRTSDGTVTSFDPKGSIDTAAYGVNDSGAITGYYVDNNYVDHGFVRTP
jgi:hypothetical protein